MLWPEDLPPSPAFFSSAARYIVTSTPRPFACVPKGLSQRGLHIPKFICLSVTSCGAVCAAPGKRHKRRWWLPIRSCQWLLLLLLRRQVRPQLRRLLLLTRKLQHRRLSRMLLRLYLQLHHVRLNNLMLVKSLCLCCGTCCVKCSCCCATCCKCLKAPSSVLSHCFPLDKLCPLLLLACLVPHQHQMQGGCTCSCNPPHEPKGSEGVMQDILKEYFAADVNESMLCKHAVTTACTHFNTQFCLVSQLCGRAALLCDGMQVILLLEVDGYLERTNGLTRLLICRSRPGKGGERHLTCVHTQNRSVFTVFEPPVQLFFAHHHRLVTRWSWAACTCALCQLALEFAELLETHARLRAGCATHIRPDTSVSSLST